MRFTIVLLTLCCLGFTSLGCKSVHWNKAQPEFAKANKSKSKKDEAGLPERMVVIWKDSVYTHADGQSTRGFGGRFYFYDKESRPVKVEGELVVYGFDDSKDRKNSQADHKYVFTAEQLPGHFAETPLGPSYSVWIPWDQVGGERKDIALIPILKSTDGKIVKGDQTIGILPGRVPEKYAASQGKAGSSPRAGRSSMPDYAFLSQGITHIPASGGGQAEWAQAIEGQDNSQQAGFYEQSATTTGRLRSTTIEVPQETAARLSQMTSPIPRSAETAANPKGKELDAGASRSAAAPVRGDNTTAAGGVGNSRNSEPKPIFGQPGAFR